MRHGIVVALFAGFLFVYLFCLFVFYLFVVVFAMLLFCLDACACYNHLVYSGMCCFMTEHVATCYAK